MGIYIDDEPVDEILDGNYEIDASKTKCKINGDEVSGLEFTINGNKVGIFGITTKNTKCTIYLNTIKDQLDTIIAQAKTDKPDFNKTSCKNGTNNVTHSEGTCGEETNGLYKETTKLGDTYYYRGSVNNNWVKYGTNASGLPIWWRIVRINEDRTVRLIYAGEGNDAPASDNQVDGQGGYWMSNSYGIGNTNYPFNNLKDFNAYVGYMYGTPNSETFNAEHGYDLINAGTVDQLHSSNVKTKIDEWYKNNLSDEGNVLSGSTGFCGDRTIADYDDSGYYSNLGYGKEGTYYKIADRMSTNYTPSFECLDSTHDLYTTKTYKGNGNGALDYPIGLITADEIIYAGSSRGDNYGFWLLTGKMYWTTTPFKFDKNTTAASLYLCSFSGSVIQADITLPATGVRPVVNVLPTYFKTEGHDGTINNPYIVEV